MLLSSPDEHEPPPLWQKPASSELLACLRGLRLDLPIWNHKDSRADILREVEATAHQRREIVQYLSGIVKSSLAWIEDEAEREQIWDEASKRLSERCGRAAMGEMTRRWPFTSSEGIPSEFELVIREPPLTGDSLGLKTWGSSYVLAQLLPRFASGPLSHLFPPPLSSPSSPTTRAREDLPLPLPLPFPVLELGSGTGLLGLAAACLWRAPVVLTDLPAILPNLRHNAELNRGTVEARGGRVEAAAALTWGGTGEDESDTRFLGAQNKNWYKLILAADPLYDDEHPRLLAGAIDAQLALGPDARALVMIPQRDGATKDLTLAFVREMAAAGRLGDHHALVCTEQGTEAGQDDWGGDEDRESQSVVCWWGVFQRGVLAER